MKESYYTDISIQAQSELFLEKIKLLRKKHKFCLDSKKIALLVIDCQNFFFDSASHAFVPNAVAILPRLVQLQNYCLQNGIPVFQTKHVNTNENAKMMSKWWGGRILLASDPLSDIVSDLYLSDDIVVSKSQYDPFYKTELDSLLKSQGVKQLIITGVMTHLCCETAARCAFGRGYEVFFSIDGTATYNREFHLASLISSAHGFATPMLIDEIVHKLQEGRIG